MDLCDVEQHDQGFMISGVTMSDQLLGCYKSSVYKCTNVTVEEMQIPQSVIDLMNSLVARGSLGVSNLLIAALMPPSSVC